MPVFGVKKLAMVVVATKSPEAAWKSCALLKHLVGGFSHFELKRQKTLPSEHVACSAAVAPLGSVIWRVIG